MRDYLRALSNVIYECWSKPALTDIATLEGLSGVDYSYGQMYGAIVALCDRFEELGIHDGDHIAICGANSASWLIAYLAIARYHAVSVMIMHSLTSDAIAKMVAFSDSVAIIADREILECIASNDMPCVHRIVMEELPKPKLVDKEMISLGIDDENALASICFTSGSSGMAKGVMVPYRGVYLGAFGIAENLSMGENNNIVSFAPLAHILGFGSEVLTPLCQGSHIYFAGSLVTMDRLLQMIMHVKPYRILLFPMILNKLVEMKDTKIFSKLNFLRCCLTGGAKITPEMTAFCEQVGLPLTMGYGLTESSGLISLSDPAKYRMGSVGKPIAAMKVKITEKGEIVVKGDNVMLGYYKDPEATAAKIDKDGWLHTGDRGHMDEDGYLYVEGRLEQDMIVLPSGENISPAKVEAIINACEGVEESIVIARDGKLLALVVLQTASCDIVHLAGDTIAAQQNLRNNLLAQINPQLPAYSQLFGIEFLSEPLARTEKKTLERYLYK